jgi:hypothetical protein
MEEIYGKRANGEKFKGGRQMKLKGRIYLAWLELTRWWG